MEKITIEVNEHGFKVSQGDKYAELAWDEMLGLVAALTMPENCPCLQWMKTKEQQEAQMEAWRKSAEEISIVPFEEAEEVEEPTATFECAICNKTLPATQKAKHTPSICESCAPF